MSDETIETRDDAKREFASYVLGVSPRSEAFSALPALAAPLRDQVSPRGRSISGIVLPLAQPGPNARLKRTSFLTSRFSRPTRLSRRVRGTRRDSRRAAERWRWAGEPGAVE
jgi:hypothetical protein